MKHKYVTCECPDFKPNMKLVEAPRFYENARNPGTVNYTGKFFVYCPWCGSKLIEKEWETT